MAASLESHLAFSEIGFSLECPIDRLYGKLKLGIKNLYYNKTRILVVCLSTNGERALNYTIVIQTTKIKLSC